jgi:hypothetical protein
MYCSACGQPMDASQRSARSVGGRVLRSRRMLLRRIPVIACTGICTPWQFSGSHTASGFCCTGSLRSDFSQEPTRIGPTWAMVLMDSTHSRFSTRPGSCRSSLRSGRPSYPLPCHRSQPAASRIVGANARHRNCLSRAYSPICRNCIRHLYAVGTLALRFRPGVRADSCGMRGGSTPAPRRAWRDKTHRAVDVSLSLALGLCAS